MVGSLETVALPAGDYILWLGHWKQSHCLLVTIHYGWVIGNGRTRKRLIQWTVPVLARVLVWVVHTTTTRAHDDDDDDDDDDL